MSAISVESLPETTAGPSNKDVVEKKQAVVAGIVNKEDESDVAKDEKKDSEKPLMPGDDDTIAIQIEPKKDGSDTPTLPLPQRVSKTRLREDKPSMFFNPGDRIRYTWDNSSGLSNFFISIFYLLCVYIGITAGCFPILPIVQLVIGSIYLGECTAEPMIPDYLIVSGVFGIILAILDTCTKSAKKKDMAQYEARKRRCIWIEIILRTFLIVWFIAGCFWVYTVFEPEYKMKNHPDYCNKTLYLFTFWMFNITFIVIIFIITLGICCTSLVAIESKKPPE